MVFLAKKGLKTSVGEGGQLGEELLRHFLAVNASNCGSKGGKLRIFETQKMVKNAFRPLSAGCRQVSVDALRKFCTAGKFIGFPCFNCLQKFCKQSDHLSAFLPLLQI